MNKKKFGPIYALASNGKTKIWSAQVIDNKIYYSHGYIDGKQIIDEQEVKSKNIGKSNETSPFEQACLEAQSKMNKKTDKGYQTKIITNISEVKVELPMLANKYKERKKYLKFPAYIQPKLDGIRNISKLNGSEVSNISRNGKPTLNLNHFNKDIKNMLDVIKLSLDGEAYNPQWTFQEITRAYKKERESTKELEYWIYDIVDTKSKFSDRNSKIKNYFNKSQEVNSFGYRKIGCLVEVPTYIINNEEELNKYHKTFTSLGFEGSIMRNSDGLYLLNHRSNDLLKLKDFDDSEYIIVEGHEAENEPGTVIFTCITKEGKEFTVRPKGSTEYRKEMLLDIKNIIGKELTIRHQGISEEGKPRFPVGICVRTYES